MRFSTGQLSLSVSFPPSSPSLPAGLLLKAAITACAPRKCPSVAAGAGHGRRAWRTPHSILPAAAAAKTSRDERHTAVPPGSVHRGGSCRLAADKLVGAAMFHPELRVARPRARRLRPQPLLLQRPPHAHQHARHVPRGGHGRAALRGLVLPGRQLCGDFPHH